MTTKPAIPALPVVSCCTIPAGTVLYHQRFNGVFCEGKTKPYAPVNYFSRTPFYGDPYKSKNLNTYCYRVDKDIPNVLQHNLLEFDYEDLLAWVSDQTKHSKDVDARNIHSYLPWLQHTFKYNGLYHDVSDMDNEYRLLRDVVDHHLTLVFCVIHNTTVPDKECGGAWPF